MSERKFTDDEIIKALECCKNADCLNCPQWSEEWTSGMCNGFLQTVLDLINRQKAEIERLQWGEYRHIGKTVMNARKEAIEEFAERLKEHFETNTDDGETNAIYVRNLIDNLVKEMTEDLK